MVEAVKQQTMQQLVDDVMARQGLTVEKLAETLGVHRRTIESFIGDLGKRRNQLNKVTRFSLALNKPGNWLLRELQKRGLR